MISLFLLVIQNSSLALLTKFSYRDGTRNYNREAVILAAELVKLLTCVLLEAHSRKSSVRQVLSTLKLTRDTLPLLVPASLYVLQNLLQLYSIRGLSPGFFVVASQLKIPSSACFRVLLLRQQLTKNQLVSTLFLFAGISIIQLASTENIGEATLYQRQRFYALSALMGAVTISGFAGTVLEISFKQPGASVWVKNTFLSIFSIPAAVFMLLVQQQTLVGTYSNIFYGFDLAVVAIVVLLACGGILTAVVMKHSSNLTKCFAVSVSIIICNTIDVITGQQICSTWSVLGIALATFAVYMYSL